MVDNGVLRLNEAQQVHEMLSVKKRTDIAELNGRVHDLLPNPVQHRPLLFLLFFVHASVAAAAGISEEPATRPLPI